MMVITNLDVFSKKNVIMSTSTKLQLPYLLQTYIKIAEKDNVDREKRHSDSGSLL